MRFAGGKPKSAVVVAARGGHAPGQSARQRLATSAVALLLAILPCFVAGCEADAPLDYGDPTSQEGETVVGGIYAQVLAPRSGDAITGPAADLVVAAWTEEGTALEVAVTLAGGRTVDALREGSGRNAVFVAPLTLAHGNNSLRVRIREVEGSRSRILDYVVSYAGDAPGVRISAFGSQASDGSCDGTSADIVTTATACVYGVATARRASQSISSVTLQGSGGPVDATVQSDGSFVGAVEVAPDAASTITATVTDSDGRSEQARAPILHDGMGPSIGVTEPPDTEFNTTEAVLTIAGTVSDASGVRSMRIETGATGTTAIPFDGTWSWPLRLVVGSNEIRVVAVDHAGNEGVRVLRVVRDRVTTLLEPAESGGAAQLDLDRFGLESLLSPEDANELVMAEIEMRPFLIEALNAIRSPAQYGVDTTQWSDAEWNLYRLVNMTSDTADLSGTSLEPMLNLANAIGLPSPRILADLMNVGVQDEFLTIEAVADVILEQLILTHPNAETNDDGDAILTISLGDALNDLGPVGERYGPVGGHPGFIDGAIYSEVFESGFLMSVAADSNLSAHEGYDASAASKDFLFVLSGDQVLNFNFDDPDTFSVVGITDEPVVDIRMFILEAPQLFVAGSDRFANVHDAANGIYRGSSTVWGADPWVIESLVAEAVFRRFSPQYAAQNYRRTIRYDAGSINDAAVIDWDHGWLTVSTSGGVGNPPDPTYAWDVLMEVAQVRLHDGGLAEGEANTEFALERIPVGLTAEDLIEALTPKLQEQEATLSELVFGDGGVAGSGVDFYYVPSSIGVGGFLFFRHAGDTDEAYNYARPGFFSDAALTTRVSTSGVMAGTTDTTHEKISASAGTRVFFEDDEGGRYQLDIVGRIDGGIEIVVVAQ